MSILNCNNYLGEAVYFLKGMQEVLVFLAMTFHTYVNNVIDKLN